MFADSTLAARIDRAEGRLVAQMAAEARSDAGGGPIILPISGGVSVFAGPRSPMNKVIGLGFDTELDLDALREVEDRWCEREEPVRIELATLTDPAIGGALSDRGYRLRGFENVLARRLDDLPAPAAFSDISIDLVGADDVTAWFEVAVDSFANMDGTGSVADDPLSREELARSLEDLLGGMAYNRYLARIDGRAVGEAALHVDDRLALLAGSGTRPAYRGRGVQKALVQRRLHDARDAGCDFAVVVTAPGTRSQDNVMRRGFELLYSRAILIKPI
jgi:N-acetylglutamate synthase-like GNAT family acetyltransferase